MGLAFSINELFDMVLMTLVSGYIFMDYFRSPTEVMPSFYQKLKYSVLLISVPILLHELGHKMVATMMGLTAVFHAAYNWLVLGVIIKLVGFPFLIMVPAYVSITGTASPYAYGLTAFAGPGVNGVLYIIAYFVLRKKNLSERAFTFWRYSKFINGFLFVFNLLPIPGFDGFQFYANILRAII